MLIEYSTSKRAKAHAKAVSKDMAEDEGSDDFGDILMIWSSKRCLIGPRIAHDAVNPRILELEVTKEILAELFDGLVK
jgi:hypothetical protein